MNQNEDPTGNIQRRIEEALHDRAWLNTCSGRPPGRPALPGATAQQIAAKLGGHAKIEGPIGSLVAMGVIREHHPRHGVTSLREPFDVGAGLAPRYTIR